MFAGSMQHLFADTAALGDSTPNVLDLLSAKYVRKPQVDKLDAGFPCQDVSKLSVYQQQHRTVIQDRALRTGGVFHDILSYVRNHGDNLVCLTAENVLGLLDHAGTGDDLQPSNCEVP